MLQTQIREIFSQNKEELWVVTKAFKFVTMVSSVVHYLA